MNSAVHPVKRDLAIHESEERPIAADANVLAGVEIRPALPDEDTAGSDNLASEPLHTEALADAVATIANTALTFLMCHKSFSRSLPMPAGILDYSLISFTFTTVNSWR